MNKTFAILTKELNSYFNSASAYIVISLFLILTGWFFVSDLFLNNNATLYQLFDRLPFIFLFFIPAISMKLISEEKKNGTIELIFTMPLKEEEVVLGKFLACTSLVLITLFGTFIYVITIGFLGNPDYGIVISGYFGIILVSIFFVSVGVFSSALSSNQIVSFVISFFILFIFYLMDKLVVYLPSKVGFYLNFLSFDYHLNFFLKGIISVFNISYFISMTALFVYLTVIRLKLERR